MNHRPPVKTHFAAAQLYRAAYYALGLLFLALGITLNTKTALGVSPLISLPNSLALLYQWNLGNAIAVYYTLMVVAQLFIKGRGFRWYDLLQAPMSVLFTRLINLFNASLDFSSAPLGVRLLLLLAAIVCTGLGAALTVDMDLIPNAADGLVGAISLRSGREMGFVKNMVDLTAVILTALTGLLLAQRVVCIGLGTLLTVLGTGRVVALFNRVCLRTIRQTAGLTGAA